jgi:1,4-dihydroxy-2-naphthoyl-CoA hydrolase
MNDQDEQIGRDLSSLRAVRRVSGVEFAVPFERSFDAVYGLEHLGSADGAMRGRLTVTDAVRGPDGAVHSGVFFAAAESLASTGTAVAVLPEGLIPSGLSNSTHVLVPAREGVLTAVASCRARGELDWLWDVEVTGEDGTLHAVSSVVIAVRPART